MSSLRDKIQDFISSEKEAPLLTFLAIAITPVLFYVSNNYWAVNSLSHLLFFSAFIFGFVLLLYGIYFFVFRRIGRFKSKQKHVLFWLITLAVIIFLSQTYFNSTLKRIALLVGMAVIGFVLPFNPRKHYKKMVVVLLLFSCLSFVRMSVNIYEDIKRDIWLEQPDDIENVKFKSFPNVYMIQPDGYVSKKMMQSSPYNYKSDLYDWLDVNGFKVYDNFRSNYPASLTSNASLFAMKQHKYADMIFPKIEFANGREVITKHNPVASIFNSNGYETYFIAEDEYFQQNKKQEIFDYYNIEKDDFSHLTKGGNEVRDVYKDFKAVYKPLDSTPKFFFIEKLMPHHVAFFKTDESVLKERDRYLSRIEEVNIWLKDIINYISEKDGNGIIIILADHGGWVGLRSFNDLYSNEKPELINSIFSNIAAIKWTGHLEEGFDKDLESNVNVFRVLFASLSKNEKYLDHMEEDISYNLRLNSFGNKDVIEAIDHNGNVTTKDK
ncbi:alkaline phosphatase family protein [Winogradskyella alexanderae]|uniref:Sulfatase-like hydrolase/transferase n=1 Tax=Winogradskyella alexanderae TaxID=2877123 RepID=A0ABS7XVC7_9FLAO|nr:sulfatase-like hydrolase/transferase [Winogradskyella alexanderae]MCA0132862.1 sulfatase-like hydrolase/transferase [Winogradskyella alexanderae]